MMKRLFTLVTLMAAWTLCWADSPLTSTHFADSYSDHPMVQMASEEMQGDISTTLLNFLADKNAPIDVRLAVINKIGWNFDGTSMGTQLGNYLMGRYKVKNEKKLVKKLDAKTLAVYAYAKAMSNYFDVAAASEMGHQAVKKNKDKSFSVAFISSLIDAQVYLDNDWSMVHKVVANVLNDGSLRLDMRQEAIDSVMDYINLYKEYE
ncbi:MAG: hypothetical protein IKW97_00480 [Muribaculaceae bacterium]|nr:hypothetical protein [Muribaculaceae bacterium]